MSENSKKFIPGKVSTDNLKFWLAVASTELNLPQTTVLPLGKSSLTVKRQWNFITPSDLRTIDTASIREVTVRHRPINRDPHAGEWAANPLFLNRDYTEKRVSHIPAAVISFQENTLFTGLPRRQDPLKLLESRLATIRSEMKTDKVTPSVVEQALLEEQAGINNKQSVVFSPPPARLVILDSGDFVFVGLENAHANIRVLDSHVKDPVSNFLQLTTRTTDQNGRRLVIVRGSVTLGQRLQVLKDDQIACSVQRMEK